MNPTSIDSLDFSGVNNIEGARTCLSAFFGILLDANVHKRRLEMENNKLKAVLEQQK